MKALQLKMASNPIRIRRSRLYEDAKDDDDEDVTDAIIKQASYHKRISDLPDKIKAPVVDKYKLKMENGDDLYGIDFVSYYFNIDGYYEYLENTGINFHSQPEPNIEEAPTRGDGVVQEEARAEAIENVILCVNTNGGEHQDYPIVPNLPMVQAAQDCLEVNIQLRRNEEDVANAGEGLLMLHTMQEVPNGIDLVTIAALLLSSAVAPEIGSSTEVVV